MDTKTPELIQHNQAATALIEVTHASNLAFLPETEIPEKISIPDISKVRNITYSTTSELITEEVIYASSNKGNNGIFHAMFGRDTVITALQALEAILAQQERFGNVDYTNADIFRRSINGVFTLSKFQAKEDIYHGSVKVGQELHERRVDNHGYLTSPDEPHLKPWRSNGEVMEVYDSVDVTPLAALFKGRIASMNHEFTKEQEESYKLDLKWCMNNLDENNGFVAYTFDDSEFGGLMNQGWMDSDFTMLHQDGRERVYPMAPVEVQGIVWAAMKYGADYYEGKDFVFSNALREKASQLKAKFNGESGYGFITSEGKPYFAEAIDGNGERVENVTSNPAFLLWASHNGEFIVDEKGVNNIAKMLGSDELFNPEAGLRTYSKDTDIIFSPDGYHNGRETYWPLISGIASAGLYKAGYRDVAKRIGTAALKVTDSFNSCMEIGLMKNGKLETWKNTSWLHLIDQNSAHDHILTAGANHFILNRFY